MVVFDVVAVRPAVVLVLIDTVWVLLAPVVVGLEGGRANCGAPLLHRVPCLVPPAGGGDGGVGPVHRGLLLEGAGHLNLHVGVVLHGVVEHRVLLCRGLVHLILKVNDVRRHVGFELLLALLHLPLTVHHCVGTLIEDGCHVLLVR